MKKIFRITIPIGMILFLFVIFHTSQNAYGATKNALIGVEEKNDTDQVGPPWYNESWNYRQPIYISNNGAPIVYYHVLVRLDSTNFEFDRAKEDGSDIRFTDGSGKNLISFWKESWNKSIELAYFWVLVSNLSPEPYDTVIYIYYGNSSAISQSNGFDTFDSFDDNWSQFIGMGFNLGDEALRPEYPKDIESLFTWTIISGSPSVSNNTLILNGAGIRSTSSSYLYQAVGYRAIFGSGTGNEWIGFIDGTSGNQTRIGDNPDKNNLYLMNYVNASNNISIPRVGGLDWHDGYHVYEVRWWDDLGIHKSMGDIDHGAS